MEIIGITGQIGAGKSTVCASLRKRGYTHIDADAVAKSLYVPGGPLLARQKSPRGDCFFFTRTHQTA